VSERKRRVAAGFDGAEAYERHAAPQRQAAERLARLIAKERLPERSRVLELGCGIGFLTAPLLALRPWTGYLATDIAPRMLVRCKKRIEGLNIAPSPHFLGMDAEIPAVMPVFELIVSSMALHWVDDLDATLRGILALLAPNGLLALSIPGARSYREWRQAVAAAGGHIGVCAATTGFPLYPNATGLSALLPGARIEEQEYVVEHARGLELFRALKAMGARTPVAGYAPQPALFRAALSHLEAQGSPVRVTFHALFALFRKEA
jgi:malonyl-CoA O-methyltransferase